MLLEHRTYTLRQGRTGEFIAAQNDRGYELVRPITERLLGYFTVLDAPEEAIVHLYYYSDFQDWQVRLHGLYNVEALRPYFAKVRALMIRQENSFFAPAPESIQVGGWRRIHNKALEERQVFLKPSAAPLYWKALQTLTQESGNTGVKDFLGAYASLTGRLSRIVEYRATALAGEEDSLATLRASDAWERFRHETDPIQESVCRRTLIPVGQPEMSPFLTTI